MQNERALITRLEAANTDDLIGLLLNAAQEKEKILRIYLTVNLLTNRSNHA